MKVALRKLRRFARNAEREEFDLDGDHHAAPRATPAGSIMKYRRERHNAIKLMVLFDIGGSMDEHIRLCEELFSAARAASSSTSNTSTSTTSCTSGCGRTTTGAMVKPRRRST
jgi:uncharacterized protein with von Willebrand factor type A (vWA) domain